jgi:hypothetical protein
LLALAMRRFVPAVIVVLALASAGDAVAHPAPFSFLDLHVDDSGVSGTLTVHDLDAAYELKIADAEALLDPTVARRHGPALAAILTGRLRLLLDGMPVAFSLADAVPVPDRQGIRFALGVQGGRMPGRLRVETLMFPYDPNHQTFINVYERQSLRYQAILDARYTAMDYYTGTWQGAGAVLMTFVPSGVEHILIGPDHILFLLGLLLLGGSARRLALIVTAFTLGHSVTLSMAALDLYTPPAGVVEPLIALSIVLVGVDNLLVGGQPSGGRDLRPWMAGLFGLVHGFGFASVLKEFGLPREALGWSLFGFNAGVELGQLAVVVPCAIALAALARYSVVARARLAMVGSMVVVAAGAYWFVERVFFPGGLT